MWKSKSAGLCLALSILLAGLGLQTPAAAQTPWGSSGPYFGYYGTPYGYPYSLPIDRVAPVLPFGTWTVTTVGPNTYYRFQPYSPYDASEVGGATYYHLNPYGAWLLEQQAAARAALQRAYQWGRLDAERQAGMPANR